MTDSEKTFFFVLTESENLLHAERLQPVFRVGLRLHKCDRYAQTELNAKLTLTTKSTKRQDTLELF